MEVEYKFYLKSKTYLNELLQSSFWDEFNSDTWTKHHFVAKYFDTEDLTLSNNKFSLRIRLEDETKVLTVKTPKLESDNRALSRRGEWNFVWSPDTPNISFLIESLGHELGEKYIDLLKSIEKEPLYANMTTDVYRYKRNLFLSETQIEVVLDSGKLYGGKLSDDIQEIELELIAGDESKLVELADIIKQRFELTDGNKSKMQRCFELLEKSRQLHG